MLNERLLLADFVGKTRGRTRSGTDRLSRPLPRGAVPADQAGLSRWRRISLASYPRFWAVAARWSARSGYTCGGPIICADPCLKTRVDHPAPAAATAEFFSTIGAQPNNRRADSSQERTWTRSSG